MAPITTASNDDTHQSLLDRLDVQNIRRDFRNAHWRPGPRRNKTVKQIISEASRKEASVLVTQNNSGATTPLPDAFHTAANGSGTPDGAGAGAQRSLKQAAKDLSKLVRERNAQGAGGPAITYTNIESAPSLHPLSQRHYCDITGLPAPYTDPKTRLRFHNAEVFGVVRTLGQHSVESYLAARGAHTVLK